MARFSVKIGKRLRQEMDEKNMSVSELADILNYNENDLERLLKGDLVAPPQYMENICAVLGISFPELIRAAVK